MPLIIFPEFQKIKEDVEKLRVELSMVILERDELRLVICKNIEAEYMIKLGGLERKAYEKQCCALRLKRKIELIQARINRQEPIDLLQIDSMLDDEFAEYQRKLDEQIGAMNRALKRSRAERLSAEDEKEFKKLYRSIVKKLHPDLNPDLTPEKSRLFQTAVDAYESGDLPTLRAIDEALSDGKDIGESEDALVKLVHEAERLKKAIADIKEDIEKIKLSFPYNVKELIDKPEKEQARRRELKKIISYYDTLLKLYRERLDNFAR